MPWWACHFFLAMSNKKLRLWLKWIHRKPFIRLTSLLTSVWVVATSRSFIVAFFAHSDIMLTCWKMTFFCRLCSLACRSHFFECRDPPFFCLCRLRSHLRNRLRHGSLLGQGPWTELIRTEVVWRLEEPHLRYSLLLGLWPWTELIRTEVVWRLEEPHLRYSSLLGLWALNGTGTHGSGVKTWRATLAIQFAAWLMSLERNWYPRKWHEDYTCNIVRRLALGLQRN